ncbi:MAG: GNAT family N-acetyltransferase [Chitinophagales bacterium]
MVIRQMAGTEPEIRRVNEIYNAAVRSRFMTADMAPMSLADRRARYLSMDPNAHPVFLAIQDNGILGWLAIKPYREGREALSHTKELSYVVDHTELKKGIGTV